MHIYIYDLTIYLQLPAWVCFHLEVIGAVKLLIFGTSLFRVRNSISTFVIPLFSYVDTQRGKKPTNITYRVDIE